ncbi:MAG: hypothetical protein AAB263_05065 [Planctomycetota bacterium]
MATPRRIFRIYHLVGQQAERIRKEQLAKGETLSSTVKLLCERDAGKLLGRWGEEMQELCGVIDGSHQDPYILEATQVFYWASLYAIVKGVDWDGLEFDRQRALATTTAYATAADLMTEVDLLVTSGPDKAVPARLFQLWNIAEQLHRRWRPSEVQPTLEEVMDYDLDEMSQRAYLQPFLERVTD